MQISLNNIKSPADLKGIAMEGLPALAEQIRAKIIEVTSKKGGHIAPSLFKQSR